MLFDIHPENRISYKRLTDADLKRSPKSHQTHIGLSNKSLTFMQDNKTEYSAMVIYEFFCDIVPCEVGKILRKSGRQDAHNIKSGGVGSENNVVKCIRDFASQKPNLPFYLLWFGLDSGTPLFWLIAKDSPDYVVLNGLCDFEGLKDRDIITLDSSDIRLPSILQYARTRLESVTIDLQKDLEISAEVDADNPKFKNSDVKKAKSYIQEIGRKGEELINEYLQKEFFEHRICSYEWANKSSEKGQPFDFFIKYSSGLEQWVDVKTTEHSFDQQVIISRNEINFIADKKNPEYAIYRVYSKEEASAKLKVCSHCLKYIKKLQRDIDYITASLSDYRASIVNYKIAFEPSVRCFESISSEISI